MAYLSGRFCFHIFKNMAQNDNPGTKYRVAKYFFSEEQSRKKIVFRITVKQRLCIWSCLCGKFWSDVVFALISDTIFRKQCESRGFVQNLLSRKSWWNLKKYMLFQIFHYLFPVWIISFLEILFACVILEQANTSSPASEDFSRYVHNLKKFRYVDRKVDMSGAGAWDLSRCSRILYSLLIPLNNWLLCFFPLSSTQRERFFSHLLANWKYSMSGRFWLIFLLVIFADL